MSHTTQIETRMKERASLEAACKTIGATMTIGTARLFDGTTADGYVLRLPGWSQPVIIDQKTGEAKMDNYGGRWGKIEVFNELRKQYTAEESTRRLSRDGFRVTRRNVNGKIVVTATR